MDEKTKQQVTQTINLYIDALTTYVIETMTDAFPHLKYKRR